MTPDQKLIEYYFYHFTEYDFEEMKELTALQKEVYQQKRDFIHQKPWVKTSPDAVAVLMGQAFHRTYRHFFGEKRELLKLRYLHNISREDICRKLKISHRTYHRHVVELIEFAEHYAKHMRLAQADFSAQVQFFSKDNFENTYSNEYFSDYTQV